jgi:hypothetical protein
VDYWILVPLDERTIRHAWLTDLIRQIHQHSRGTYGARRVHAELTLGHQVTVSHGAVELLMRRAGLEGLGGRPKWRRPKPDQIATDSQGPGRITRRRCEARRGG